MHEIGHRQWFKFLSGGQQKTWRAYYLQNSYQSMDMSTVPKVGDIPPEFNQEIIKIVGLKFFVDDRRYLTFDDIKRLYTWPSHYSAASAEEFYAECFRLSIEGKLQEPFKGWFEGLGK
jgi:hypothetical protein